MPQARKWAHLAAVRADGEVAPEVPAGQYRLDEVFAWAYADLGFEGQTAVSG